MMPGGRERRREMSEKAKASGVTILYAVDTLVAVCYFVAPKHSMEGIES